MADDDKTTWLNNVTLAEQLTKHRTNDVKVNVDGLLVPVGAVHYKRDDDVLVIEFAPDLAADLVREAFECWREHHPVDEE